MQPPTVISWCMNSTALCRRIYFDSTSTVGIFTISAEKKIEGNEKSKARQRQNKRISMFKNVHDLNYDDISKITKGNRRRENSGLAIYNGFLFLFYFSSYGFCRCDKFSVSFFLLYFYFSSKVFILTILNFTFLLAWNYNSPYYKNWKREAWGVGGFHFQPYFCVFHEINIKRLDIVLFRLFEAFISYFFFIIFIFRLTLVRKTIFPMYSYFPWHFRT